MKGRDEFAGAGGWDVYAAELGIEMEGVELMPEAVATREAAGLTTSGRDVRDEHLEPGEVDLAVASPPCQTFSKAGLGAGRKALETVLWGINEYARDRSKWPTFEDLAAKTGDERTALVLEPLRLALEGLPTYIAWEQVPTVLPVWEACADLLRARGYSVATGNVHAEQHGVPQTRTRAVLAARRDGAEAKLPTPTHSRYYPRDPKRLDECVLHWISMAEALEWSDDGRDITDLPDGAPRIVGASSVSWPFERPAPTVVGTFAPDVIAAPGYRKKGDPPRQKTPGSVRVTLAEAAVLQSFPADFPFQGPKGKRYLQVGNAIPPLLARAILAELIA